MGRNSSILASAVSAVITLAAVGAAPAYAGNSHNAQIKHVLLISVDGLHQVDVENYVKSHPKASTIQYLMTHGVSYTNASTSKPSDSFPGLTALVTGASPKLSGVYYDDSYDRKLSPPNNLAPGDNCKTVGTETQYAENINTSYDDNLGGATLLSNEIDPDRLPRDGAHGCTPVYPHQFLRVNTIFNVAHDAGLYTAWSDKHPAYELVRGPANTGAEDLYTPEINSPPRALKCVTAEGPGGNPDSCAVIDPNAQWTSDVSYTTVYDDLKVQAVVNEIKGFDHTGKTKTGVPAIFGMNFQSVSVGQKLTADGYTDAAGTPSAGLGQALDFVDASLGKFVAALKQQKIGDHTLLDETLIVVGAKHGQSPIDVGTLHMIYSKKHPNPKATLDVTDVTDVLATAGVTVAQATEDDISLLWLQDQTMTDTAVAALEANRKAPRVQKIYSDKELKKLFGDPSKDTRTPDLIVQPIPGTIYSGSAAKIAEHGGFAEDDTHTALIVSNPNLKVQSVSDLVTNQQVAPTILSALGLKIQALDAVRKEQTRVLPGLEFEGSGNGKGNSGNGNNGNGNSGNGNNGNGNSGNGNNGNGNSGNGSKGKS